ncbi:MAG: alpha/beta fold hydrolase [Alphaproteobacteria bacterium]|nr:alpha/beta fold hydrolase [Alphaproteobacteria bacterium]
MAGDRDCVIDVNGQGIAVRRIPAPSNLGEPAPILVFLHEGLGCVGMWKDFPDALSAATGCSALIYDRLGHGGSGPAETMRDLTYFENEAYSVLPALLSASGVTDSILIGHSDGGTIALLHAGRARVRGVVTEAAHVFVEPESRAGVAAAKSAWQDERFRKRLARYHGVGTEAMFTAWFDMWSAPWFQDWNIEDALPAIDCPVLAIQGNDDEYGTAAQVAAIARGVSGPVTTLLVAGCGHSPHIQARDVVLDRMAAFVRSLIE